MYHLVATASLLGRLRWAGRSTRVQTRMLRGYDLADPDALWQKYQSHLTRMSMPQCSMARKERPTHIRLVAAILAARSLESWIPSSRRAPLADPNVRS